MLIQKLLGVLAEKYEKQRNLNRNRRNGESILFDDQSQNTVSVPHVTRYQANFCNDLQ